MNKKKGAALAPRRLLVTSALPYANNDIHLGHLVEAVQTDIFVRYRKLRGDDVVYVCADDTHGTPIELSALKQEKKPEQLIEEVWRRHVADYKAFDIDFDIFYSTNSPENRRYAEYVYRKLQEAGLIVSREIRQLYCPACQRFLPDRFVTGTCPRCGARDQYGDVCEACGAAYEPTELVGPRCMICSGPPELKPSTHLYVTLEREAPFLRDYVLGDGEVLPRDIRKFVASWIDEGLKDWCISRDGPYFGFPIPGLTNKFFYVWLDAPIGYLSSTRKWCEDRGEDIDAYWGAGSPTEIVHFIGKDIVYFHALFWPVMLQTAGFNLPRRINVHGFLSVQGEKMSKTRGTFILARDYVERFTHPAATSLLRFYFGSKLTNNTGDFDLNADEFCSRVNTTLVNNIGNLHHRTVVFCERYFNGRVPDAPWDEELARVAAAEAAAVADHYERVEFRQAVERIHMLGNLGNKYYQDSAPWALIKTDPGRAATVMVTCANLVRTIAVLLKPMVPRLMARIESRLGAPLRWEDRLFGLRDRPLGKAEKLVQPVEKSEFMHIFDGGPAAAEPVARGATVGIDEFAKLDIRIATVCAAERLPKSEKLMKLQVDIGGEKRQIIAGIARHYTPGQMMGRRVVVIVNLAPAKLMGRLSQGMLLAAADGGSLSLLRPDADVSPGSTVS